ncbi:MAG: signal peptidase I [Sedimentisphaerales bacterium]|nr:signal peptidase I [Sedimentisphaerales bacterium]
MSASKTPKPGGTKPAQKKDRAAEIANAFEWLITAFILAFVFRAFVMEAFRIPTGSMADTLMGAHFRLRCPQCGYEYQYGFVPTSPLYNLPEDTIPPGPVRIGQQTRCPNCGYFTSASNEMPVANGDRILVLKCVYQFQEPKRWDVVVFKNPINPCENYIKRLIGLPGETIEIIDGDVYIDGQIARKPPKIQQELWMPVYNCDYQPVNPNQRGAFNGDCWQVPFDFGTSNWKIDPADPTRLALDSPMGEANVLTYEAPSANGFNIAYAYNDVRTYLRKPECSDLMVRFYLQPSDHQGQIGIALNKEGISYRAALDLSGQMVLSKVDGERETLLDRKDVNAPPLGVFTLVKFANVDHQLLFECNGSQLSVDLGRSPSAMEQGQEPSPRAAIFGCGKLTLSHMGVFRDIYYTGDGQASRSARAVEGSPFTLRPDEFFVLGDNSPNSEDARWWSQPSAASRGWEAPRAGVVPRYYMVGKALFVYWPSGFEFPWPQGLKAFLLQNARNPLIRLAHGLVSLRWIPNVGRMRFIYGGTDSGAGPPPRPVPEPNVKTQTPRSQSLFGGQAS